MSELVLALVLALAGQDGLELRHPEGTARAFPVIRDLDGETIGSANVVQWVEGSQLHVRSTARLKDGRTIIERAVFEQDDHRFLQLSWSWEERRRDNLLRRFVVDLTNGNTVVVTDGKTTRRRLGNTKGAFAGLGFAYAAKNLLPRLARGEVVELTAVGFTPRARTTNVTLHAVQDTVPGPWGPLKAYRVVVRADLPRFLLRILDVPDQIIWLSRDEPPAILRARVSLGEPSDPLVTVDSVAK